MSDQVAYLTTAKKLDEVTERVFYEGGDRIAAERAFGAITGIFAFFKAQWGGSLL